MKIAQRYGAVHVERARSLDWQAILQHRLPVQLEVEFRDGDRVNLMNGCRSRRHGCCHGWCRARGSSGDSGVSASRGARACRSSPFARAILRDGAAQEKTRDTNDNKREPIHQRHSIQ